MSLRILQWLSEGHNLVFVLVGLAFCVGILLGVQLGRVAGYVLGFWDGRERQATLEHQGLAGPQKARRQL